MNTIPTTNPPPPSGVIPTEVPLGITSTISETTNPINVVPQSSNIFNLNYGFISNVFQINNTMGNGTNIQHWDFEYPLQGVTAFLPNNYGSEVIRNLVPWDLVLPYYSKQCKIDWEIDYTVVKVSDSRVSADFVWNYEGNTSNYNDATLANDTVHKIFDDEDDCFSLQVPMFWLSNNVQTDNSNVTLLSPGPFSMQPAFLPKTSLDIFIRNPYQNNLMQPDTFDVVMMMRPIVRQALAIAHKTVCKNVFVEENISLPQPYFLAQRTV